MKITFDQFNRQKNLHEQRKLYAHCFPESHLSAEESEAHYQWQFASFPHLHQGSASYEYAAFDNDEMVGYYAALPYRYNIEGVLCTCGMVCDVMTHPQKRGQGIFKQLGMFATEDLKRAQLHFTSGYPIRKDVMPGHLSVGWKVGFKLPMFVSFLASRAMLQKIHLSLVAPFADALLIFFNALLSFYWRKKIPFYDVESREASETSLQSLLPFIALWEKEQNFFLIKDFEFLMWRLGKKNAHYKIFFLQKSDDIVGAALVRYTNFYGIPAAVILDCMVLRDHLQASPRMFSEIKKAAFQDRCEAVVVMMSGHWGKRYQLRKAGFLRSPYVFQFISKKLNYSMEEKNFLDEKNWHLMWIDSDRF